MFLGEGASKTCQYSVNIVDSTRCPCDVHGMKAPRLRKYGDGQHVVDLPAQHGHPRRRKFCKTKEEAKRVQREWTTELAAHGLGAPLKADELNWLRYWRSQMSLEDMTLALQSWEQQTKYSLVLAVEDFARDVDQREGRLEIKHAHAHLLRKETQDFCKFTGDVNLASVTVTHVTDWLNSLDLQPRTISHRKTRISQFFKWCYQRDMIASDISAKLPSIKVAPSDPDIYTPEQVTAILEQLTGTWKMAVAIGAYAGLRVSELGRLQFEDIREDEIYVRKGKKNKDRWVKIQGKLKPFLVTGTGLVAPGNRNTLRDAIRVACNRAGVPLMDNALRHSYASHHLVHFANPAVTATEMGHTTPQITFGFYRKAVTRDQALRYWS